MSRNGHVFHICKAKNRRQWRKHFCGGTGAVVAYAEADRSNGTSEIVPLKKKVVVLGTGWAGTSFLRNLNNPRYEKAQVLLEIGDAWNALKAAMHDQNRKVVAHLGRGGLEDWH